MLPPLPTILLVGASRGLGLAMAEEFTRSGWRVIGTAREGAPGGLRRLADAHPARVSIETLDVTEPAQIEALLWKHRDTGLDMLFVNAGTAGNRPMDTMTALSDENFARVMDVNVLGVMRTLETLAPLVKPDGLIGAMSSGQGSIGDNIKGGRDLYRASKAALNQSMRCLAARHAADSRAMVLMAPGWIRTELGGPDAPFTIAETIPTLVQTLLDQRGTPGLRFIDRFGKTVPW